MLWPSLILSNFWMLVVNKRSEMDWAPETRRLESNNYSFHETL